MEQQGRAPSFQFGVLLSQGSLRWRRFVLSTVGLTDDSPDRPLSEQLVSAQAAAARSAPMTFTRSKAAPPAAPGRGRVRLFGPVRVSDELKRTKDTVYLSIDAVDFGGKAASAELFPVDPAATKRGKLVIDPTDSLGSMGNVAPGGRTPVQIVREIHDFESSGVPHRALTHLKAMSEAMIAIVDTEGSPRVEQIVVGTEPPDSVREL